MMAPRVQPLPEPALPLRVLPLALLAEAHEEQANDAERRGDVEQAMGWFADAMRLRDVINVVTTIEIPLPAASADLGEDLGGDIQAA